MQDLTQPIENELVSNKVNRGWYSYNYFGHFCSVHANGEKNLWYCDIRTDDAIKNKWFKTKKEALRYFITEINYTL